MIFNTAFSKINPLGYLVRPCSRIFQILRKEGVIAPLSHINDGLGARARLFIIAFLIILPGVLALLFIKSYAVNVPNWDDWIFVGRILNTFHAGHLSFQDLFAQANEHRLFFPYLIMLLIALITHYNTIAECYFSWFLLCIITCVFFRVHTRTFGTKELALAAFIPVSWLVFNLKQWENLVWGYQGEMIMVVLFFLLAIYLLATTAKLRWRFAAAAVSGVICTFSLANGLAVWPIGLVTILWIRKLQPKELRQPHLKMALVWCVVGIVACVVFFAGYHFQGTVTGSDWLYNLQHPLTTFASFLAALGILMTYQSVAIGAGLLLLLSYIFIGAHIIWQRKAKLAMALSLSLILFSIISAILLAVGRTELGIAEVLASRHVTVMIPGVLGLYLGMISLELKYVNLKRFIVVFVALLIVVGGGVYYAGTMKSGQVWRSGHNITAYYLSTFRIQSDENLLKLCWDPQFVREQAELLAKDKLSVFSEPSLQPQQLVATEGSTLYSVDSINGQQLAEQNSTIIIDAQHEETVSIVGWAVDQKIGQTAGGVFVNIDGQMDIPTLYGLDRPDVAQAFRNNRYRPSGFLASFATSVLGEGQHVLSLKIVTADKKEYYEPDQNILIEVK